MKRLTTPILPLAVGACALLSGLLGLSGCSGESGSGEYYTDWDIAGGCASDQGGDIRTSGAGTEVDVCDSVGEYSWIWVTYAAPWCSASKAQAPQIRAFKHQADSDVILYAVLTAGDEVFSAATVADARSWASTHGLPATQVLTEQSSRTIPQHLLIGPDGRTFYRYVGFLDAAEMHQLLEDFRQSTRVPDVRSLPRP
jgi:hypothetical protein